MEDSNLVGFIMGKKRTEVNRIGPWICDRARLDVADSLMQVIMTSLEGKKIWIVVPEGSMASVEILMKHGFVKLASSLRMCRGLCSPMGNLQGRFSIGAPDKG